MPLNLSTKPSPSTTTSALQNRSSNATSIWSPASICEKETAAETDNIKRSDKSRKLSKYERYEFERHIKLDQTTTPGTDSDENNSICAQNNNTTDNSDNNTKLSSSSTTVFRPFSPNNVGFFTHFHKHRDINMLRQNRTDIFVVNNNNVELLRDKEMMERPDSTAHSSDLLPKSGSMEERKRDHRCFQVSVILLISIRSFFLTNKKHLIRLFIELK